MASRAARALLTLLLAGVLGAALIEWAPGADPDEFDARRTRESMEASRRRHESDFSNYLSGLLRGDPGVSRVYGQPIGRLLAERLPRTAVTVAGGLGAAWLAALALAAAAAGSRRPWASAAAIAFSGTLLSCPAAVLAVFAVLAGLPPAIAVAAVIFPRVFSHAYSQFRRELEQPHITMARAAGLGEGTIFSKHVAPGALPALIALAGVSVAQASGAAIPVEALADSPGLGQLAWRAALGRDVPLLVSATLLLAAVTIAANLVCDLLVDRLRERPAA